MKNLLLWALVIGLFSCKEETIKELKTEPIEAARGCTNYYPVLPSWGGLTASVSGNTMTATIEWTHSCGGLKIVEAHWFINFVKQEIVRGTSLSSPQLWSRTLPAGRHNVQVYIINNKGYIAGNNTYFTIN